MTLTVTKKNDGRPKPGINSLEKTVKALKDLLKKISDLNGDWCFLPTVDQMGRNDFLEVATCRYSGNIIKV